MEGVIPTWRTNLCVTHPDIHSLATLQALDPSQATRALEVVGRLIEDLAASLFRGCPVRTSRTLTVMTSRVRVVAGVVTLARMKSRCPE